MQNVRPTTTMSPCVTGTVKKTRLSDSLEESCELSETEQTSTVSVKELGALGTERIEAGDISYHVELLRTETSLSHWYSDRLSLGFSWYTACTEGKRSWLRARSSSRFNVEGCT